MTREPLVDPDEGRPEALVLAGMALAGALSLIGLAASIGTVHCPNGGSLLFPTPGVGILAGAVLASVALAALVGAYGPGPHGLALAAAAVVLLCDGGLLIWFVRFASHPTSGCNTF